jgi:hypothetical protein
MKIFYLLGALLLSVSCVAAQEDSIKNFLRGVSFRRVLCAVGPSTLVAQLRLDRA